MAGYSQRSEDHDRLPGPILGRGSHLVFRKFHSDTAARIAGKSETQGVPVEGNLAAADTEKAAKVDDGCSYLSGSVHNDLDDAPHIFVRNAADLLAENSLDLLIVDDNHRRPAGATASGAWNADQLFSSLGPSLLVQAISGRHRRQHHQCGHGQSDMIRAMHVNPPGNATRP